jgi:hypothetical protein
MISSDSLLSPLWSGKKKRRGETTGPERGGSKSKQRKDEI